MYKRLVFLVLLAIIIVSCGGGDPVSDDLVHSENYTYNLTLTDEGRDYYGK
jgi:hypothetical protein